MDLGQTCLKWCPVALVSVCGRLELDMWWMLGTFRFFTFLQFWQGGPLAHKYNRVAQTINSNFPSVGKILRMGRTMSMTDRQDRHYADNPFSGGGRCYFRPPPRSRNGPAYLCRNFPFRKLCLSHHSRSLSVTPTATYIFPAFRQFSHFKQSKETLLVFTQS